AEYYIRTGDETALPLIQKLVHDAERNYVPGGWSTRGRGNLGYGRINAAGLHVTTFLLLAAECGVDVDPHILQSALRQFVRFAGRGNVPYGDHLPESGYTDNGKNGALAFTMAAASAVSPAGEASVYARARDASAMRGFYSTHWMLHGHTGGGAGEIWRSAGMGLLHDKDTPKYRSFMDQRKWFYEMSRRHDGSFGIMGGRRYDNTAWGAGMGLSYTIPRRTLRISGAPATRHSRQVALPAQIWGTEADHDFYSLMPVPSSRGPAPDVQRERVGREYWIPTILDRISSGDADVIRTYSRHPDVEVRRRAAERLNRVGEDEVLEALRSADARLRDVGVMALENHASLRTAASMAILLEMIENPEESWWVVQRALQVVASQVKDIELLKAHTDRLLYWVEHDDWWLSGAALPIVMRLAAHAHETDRILRTVGPLMAASRRPGQWNDRHLIREFEGASDEVRQKLLAMLSAAYQLWPYDAGDQQEPVVRDVMEPFFLGRMARAISALDGGLERLYQLSQQRYPERTLAHRDLFLNSQDRMSDSPELQSRLRDLTRNELIPEFVVQNAQALFVTRHSDATSGRGLARRGQAESVLEQLVGLYQQVGVDDYNWHDYGPERTEMEWWYHTFDPVEQPPLGQERARSGRYREVTYPAGMEHWNQPDFDAAAAGWERGLAPFANRGGEMRAVANRCNRHEGRGLDFCGCAEPPNTFWEKEVLLIAGVFEIPSLEAGNAYRILYGGSSHVGFGDGTHIYVNGKQIFLRDRSVDRRQGARPMGTLVPYDRWEDFASGRVHLAAKSFLPHGGNSLTVFMQHRKDPPLRDELYRGLQLVGLRNAEWQASQDPDSDVDADDDLYIWNGEVSRNAAAIGSWKVVDEVQEIRDFDPNARQRPGRGWNPRLTEIELADDLRTSDPLLVWTGPMLLDAGRKEALAVRHARMRNNHYIFIEAGGFNASHPDDWTSSWLVFEKQ
ncbi:MAG: DUF6288 domain-containing protein, partial [Kiritimatiellia bacterium]